MNQRFMDLWKNGDQLLTGRRAKSAKANFDEILLLDLTIIERTMALYNIAVYYMDELGNGMVAKQYLEEAITNYDANPELLTNEKTGYLFGWALENLMGLALSFDEYDQWADRLRVVSTNEGILLGQVPVIHEAMEAGKPWSEVMVMLASAYYNRNDPAQDAGKYGRAAGIFDLLLENRKRLRVSRDHWVYALYEYGALMQKLSMLSVRAMEVQGSVDYEECRFYLINAKQRLDEFLATNQPTDALQILAKNLDELLEMSNQTPSVSWQPIMPTNQYTPMPLTPGSRPFNLLSCLLNLVILGALFFFAGKLFNWW